MFEGYLVPGLFLDPRVKEESKMFFSLLVWSLSMVAYRVRGLYPSDFLSSPMVSLLPVLRVVAFLRAAFLRVVFNLAILSYHYLYQKMSEINAQSFFPLAKVRPPRSGRQRRPVTSVPVAPVNLPGSS